MFKLINSDAIISVQISNPIHWADVDMSLLSKSMSSNSQKLTGHTWLKYY